MRGLGVFSVCAAMLLALCGRAAADLRYEMGSTPEGLRFIVVWGEFDNRDDLQGFHDTVVAGQPRAVVFNSAGGHPYKAMEFGRLIRQLGLGTFQPRGLSCESACALAFLGGVQRYADPGTIGVHRTSFGGEQVNAAAAVAVVQQVTADMLDYVAEMGADPALMQLALRFDSTDMRYLSGSEMAEFSVTTSPMPEASQPQARIAPAGPSAAQPYAYEGPPRDLHRQPDAPLMEPAPDWSVPEAHIGRVRYPKGHAPLMSGPSVQSAIVASFDNGTAVRILGRERSWYRLGIGALEGYMHPSWVFVDQYDAGGFEEALHIQVKSFDNYGDTEAFVQSSPIPVVAYLAHNGWYAVALRDTHDAGRATLLTDHLKKSGKIPADSFTTYGNTYVRKVCCGG